MSTAFKPVTTENSFFVVFFLSLLFYLGSRKLIVDGPALWGCAFNIGTKYLQICTQLYKDSNNRELPWNIFAWNAMAFVRIEYTNWFLSCESKLIVKFLKDLFFLATPMTDWAPTFTGLLFYMRCWVTSIVESGYWSLTFTNVTHVCLSGK